MQSATSNSTDQTFVVARAKLPDDLALSEFAVLVEAVSDLDVIARQAAEGPRTSASGTFSAVDVPPSQVVRVQYGSDFLVALQMVGGYVVAGAGAMTTVAGAFLAFAKCLDVLAAAGLKNEERLEKRDARIERAANRKFAKEAQIPALTMKAKDLPLKVKPQDEAWIGSTRAEVRAVLPQPLRTREGYYALALLAEYGVRFEVD